MSADSGLQVLRKYDWRVPRYTSYPPAPFFNQSPEEAGTGDMLDRSNRIGPSHASFYFHIPFCPRRCLFCGCHTEIGKSGSAIRDYLAAIDAELDILLPRLHSNRSVTQIHFGGGTPNSIPFSGLEGLLDKIRANMRMEAGAEIAIECDPNLLSVEKIGKLGGMGFNRLSIGIQDFDERVLAAVNRRLPKTPPAEIFRAAKDSGFSGNNLDLIYGLPLQTAASFRTAIEKAVAAGPDRISLFPYAHVPWVKGHQSRLQDLPMAKAEERLDMAWESREALLGAGYAAIGMDHFAKPEDELAVAAAHHGLRRNFQGYCTSARAGQVYGLGASAISQLHEGYIQNAKDLDRYIAAISAGRLPHHNAYRMWPIDIAVREIINDLLCEGWARPSDSLAAAGIPEPEISGYLGDCSAKLRPLMDDGLAVMGQDTVRLTEMGHFASRAVASVFDPMQHAARSVSLPRYSQAL
ncbi:MAG: oxygen-independent coproporphyrinogen III oxidase [Fibrobacteria bacterium]